MSKKHNYPSTRASTQTNAGRKGFLVKGIDTTVRLPEYLFNQICHLANKEGKSRANIIRRLLNKALNNH